jgi:hypothetical protein
MARREAALQLEKQVRPYYSDCHYLHIMLAQEEMKEVALAEAAQAVLQNKHS